MKKDFFYIKEYFKDLSFQEDIHAYFVNGKRIKSSVSQIIKKFQKPFNKYTISKIIAEKTDNKTQEEILLSWEEISDKACKLGSNVHKFGEDYFEDRSLIASNGYEKAIVNFWKSIPDFIVPVFSELQMYHKKYLFAGTADIVFYNTNTKSFIIADYKTNKNLHKNYKNTKLLPPFNKLLDTPLNMYKLQLSMYEILLDQLEVIISMRKIIWLKPNGEFETYNVKSYKDTLIKNL